MNIAREFFKTIRENWEMHVLGKKLRDKKGRYRKRKKNPWK